VTTTPDTTPESVDTIRRAVRERYARAARAVSTATPAAEATAPAAEAAPGGCCGPGCGGGPNGADPITRDLYQGEFAAEAVATSATAVQASLGCGNPVLLAELAPGESVLDLGSGGGLDVLLSARRVGPTGHAYGLDMTPEMLALARRNQAEAGVANATFLPGTMEELPLRDGLIDVVISNCVINLSGDKDAVLAEAFRVTKPGGRFAVADIVLLRELPEAVRPLVALWTGCISGALQAEQYLAKLASAGFTGAQVEIIRHYDRDAVAEFVAGLPAGEIPLGLDTEAVIDALDGAVASAFVRARKP
jgi:SAM-dependent methyltransferase